MGPVASVLVGENGVAVGAEELTCVLGTKGVLVGVGSGVRVGAGIGVRVGCAKIVGVKNGARVGATTLVGAGFDESLAVGDTTRVAMGVGIRVAVGATNRGRVAVGAGMLVAVETGRAVDVAPSPPPQAKPTTITKAAIPAATILKPGLPTHLPIPGAP